MPLVLIKAADEYQLLSLVERRLAAGLSGDDATKDETLVALGLETAEWVASICGVPAADGYGGSPALNVDCVPTFRQEIVQEVREIVGHPKSIALARRFVSSATVTLNEVSVDLSEYRLNGPAGTLTRMVSGIYPACWNSGTLVVTYTAGFATVPPIMREVARDYLAMRYRQSTLPLEDQGVRSKTINDIMSVTYRDPIDVITNIDDIARQRLDRFITSNYG
jgi:hypothetical protein